MKALHLIAASVVLAAAQSALAAGGGARAVNLDLYEIQSSSSSPSSGKKSAAASSSTIATGPDLINEMKALHASLSHLQRLLETASIQDDTELMRRSAKFFRRARWLIYASNYENDLARKTKEKRIEREGGGNKLRGGIGNGVIARSEDQERKLIQGMPELQEDRVARNLYEATITFPECKEKMLDDCLEILNQELIQLQLDAEIVIHAKRNIYQDGYNKVVIITDMTGETVMGRNNDHKAWYPFYWDDAVIGYPYMIGVDGKFDCTGKTPEECCQNIKASTPNPDRKGHYIDCHIFVPYGGKGNPKRTDRVLVNLSPDGRVQEAPIVS